MTLDVHRLVEKTPTKLFINNSFVDAKSSSTLQTLNPYDGNKLADVAAAQSEDVDLAVAAARRAFDTGPWPRMTGKERALRLRRWADKWRLYTPEIALLESLDNGKPLSIAHHIDLPVSINTLEYYAGWADGKICGQTIPLGDPNAWGYTLHEPTGVCGAIIPWNFPLFMFIVKVAPALATGCTIVVKVAEQTPLSALYVADLALLADIPEGVLNVINGYGDVAGAALAAHPDLNHLSFTGSTQVGRLVAAAAARNIVPTTLELGGKSPVIVNKDVDIDAVVEAAHQAVMFNTGQCCTAGSRTFVHADIYEEFVAKAVKRAQSVKVGHPQDAATEMGPQTSHEQLDKTLSYIKRGCDAGAKLRTGGKRIGDKGYAVEPTVFSEVKDDMSIAKDEIFGPVQSILSFRTTDEVIQRANATEYGLAAGIFAKDIEFINTVTRSLKVGTVWVNCYNLADAAMPFGGYKKSGIGREKGGPEYGLAPHVQVKAVYQQLKDTPWR